MTHFIDGPAGKLEYLLDLPRENTQPETLMVICHPHPLHEGTMHNKVVTTLSRAARECGIAALRFNYRGVMQSEGEYGNGEGEVEDLLAIIEWVNAFHQPQKIILAGFSFGGSVAYKANSKVINLSHLITVAPAVTRFPLAHYPEPRTPWLIIQGNDDDVVEPQAVFKWLLEDIKGPYQLNKMDQVGHFFHGKLIALRKTFESFLKAE